MVTSFLWEFWKMIQIANIISILLANFSVLESNLKSPKRWWCYRIFGSVLSPSTGYGCEHLGSLFSSFWRHTKRLIREQHHACSMLAPLCRVSVYLPPSPPFLRVHISNSSIIEKNLQTSQFSPHICLTCMRWYQNSESRIYFPKTLPKTEESSVRD